MKKLYTLLASLAVLGSSPIGCSFFGGGGGSPTGPAIESAFPEEGRAGAMVVLNLENFNEKKDIVLFGGVPVKAIDPVASLTGATAKDASKVDERAEKPELRETPDLAGEVVPVQKTLARLVRIPKLSAGVVEITVRRADYESEAVPFTILAASSTSSPGTETGGGDTGDTIVPKDETAGSDTTDDTAGDDATGDDPAGDDPAGDDPADLPPPPPAATATLTEGTYDLGLNSVDIHWSVSYASAAFIRVPVNYWYADVVSFGQYQGQAGGPFPYGKSLDETGLLQKLAGSLLDDDFGSMPFNYCVIPGQGRTILSHLHCYDVNPNRTAYNYVDVMIPLAQGQNAKSGVWKFRVPKTFNVFSIYYRDWSNNMQKKEIKVTNQNIIGC